VAPFFSSARSAARRRLSMSGKTALAGRNASELNISRRRSNPASPKSLLQPQRRSASGDATR
jgi:hypothetical protein